MEEGVVKIGDYGLAKLITPSQGTEHSESIGTCHYMAPEIASGKYHKPIDVYAIGVILYEMLTGRVPFEGETVGEVLMKHLTARPDLSMLRRAVPDDRRPRPWPRTRTSGPSRVYDLLAARGRPAGRRDVRFIGEGKAGAGSAAGAGRPDAAGGGHPADRGRGAGLLHRPGDPAAPAAARRSRQRIRANWDALRRPVAYRRPAPGPAARPARAAPPRRGPAPGVRRRSSGAGRPAPAGRGTAAAASRRPCPAAGSGSPSWPPRCSGPPRWWRCWRCPPPRLLGDRPGAASPQQLAYLSA